MVITALAKTGQFRVAILSCPKTAIPTSFLVHFRTPHLSSPQKAVLYSGLKAEESGLNVLDSEFLPRWNTGSTY